MPKRALGIVVAIVTIGCHAPHRKSETRAVEPPTTFVPGLSDRFRSDVPVPFEPVPGEALPVRPCGAGRRGPCLLLGWEFYNWAWGYQHLAWFMDTDGNAFEFSFDGHAHRGVRAQDADPVWRALGDDLVTEDDFARIVGASKALPGRASASEVRHALALVATLDAHQTRQTGNAGCPDGGGATISAYRFAADRKGSSPLLLQDSQCRSLIAENTSHAARELAQWVHARRETTLPFVGPKQR